MTEARYAQRFVVLLDQTPDRQVWLGYDDGGRIGNCRFAEAFRYESEIDAEIELRRARRAGKRWPRARIWGVVEEKDASKDRMI